MKLRTSLVLAALRAAGAVLAATAKRSDGGARITPAERDQILATLMGEAGAVLDDVTE